MTQELVGLFFRNKKLLLWGAALIAVAVFSLGGSFVSLVHNKLELKKLQKQSIILDEEYESLQERMTLLQNKNAAYMERLARIQYHLTKKGETEFRFSSK